MTRPTIRQAKILRTIEMMQVLLVKPKTPMEIAEILDINVRNAYHYLKLLDQLGIEIKTGTRPTTIRNHKVLKTYYIDQCPCCGAGKLF